LRFAQPFMQVKGRVHWESLRDFEDFANDSTKAPKSLLIDFLAAQSRMAMPPIQVKMDTEPACERITCFPALGIRKS
jgi:hypothetical protein